MDDFDVERVEHKIKKAQWMRSARVSGKDARALFGGQMKFITLSDRFYEEFAGKNEILQKRDRPYVCVEVQIGATFYAIPLRHHIRHKYAFFTIGEQGLDYTKAIPLLEEWYAAPFSGTIEQAEYDVLRGKDERISREMQAYLTLYRKAKERTGNKHYSGIIRFSSLQYFDIG